VTAQLGQHKGQHLGLDRQNHDVGLAGGRDVIGGDAHTVAGPQFVTPFNPRAAGDDLLRCHLTGA